MEITPITQNSFSAAIDLLKKNNLPTEDITDTTHLFVLHHEGQVAGTVAIEHDAQTALLRSLSVSEENRSSGLGIHLVQFIEQFAKEQGVGSIYLLTTTAAGFFSKLGYQQIDRNDVPAFISHTREYCSICPSSATVMKKALA
jgi:amino-acid N-acetyltransferase